MMSTQAGVVLLLDFDNARSVAAGNASLSDGRRESLGRINARVRFMHQPDLECFNNDVARRPAWQARRELDAQALQEFG